MPTVSSLAKSLNAQIDARTSDCCLIELDDDDSPVTGGSVVFQYYPESFTDTKAVNYQQKDIFGGSLPLYQWTSGGERLISFSVVFTCDVDLLNTPDSTGSTELYQRLKNAGQERRNVDIRAAVMWLRQYMLPTYVDLAVESQTADTGGTQLTIAPRKLVLCMPGTGIGYAGGDDGISGPDSVLCHMTQCDVTYEALFPSGLPRAATVQVAFAQLAQFRGAVQFPQRSAFYDDVRKGGIFHIRATTLGYNLPPKGKRVSFT